MFRSLSQQKGETRIYLQNKQSIDRNVSFKSNNNNNEKKMYNISSRIMSGEQWGKRRGRTTIANVGDTGNALHLQMRRKSLYFFSVHFRF